MADTWSRKKDQSHLGFSTSFYGTIINYQNGSTFRRVLYDLFGDNLSPTDCAYDDSTEVEGWRSIRALLGLIFGSQMYFPPVFSDASVYTRTRNNMCILGIFILNILRTYHEGGKLHLFKYLCYAINFVIITVCVIF